MTLVRNPTECPISEIFVLLDWWEHSPTRSLPHAVMPGLVPGIPLCQLRRRVEGRVDGRNKSGHDKAGLTWECVGNSRTGHYWVKRDSVSAVPNLRLSSSLHSSPLAWLANFSTM